MSAADLIAVLVSRHLRYDWDEPRLPTNDHLIFSKGHASPLLYSVFKAVGVVSEDELMTGYRRFGQRLQGHPTPVLPWVDVATGSLGQGCPMGSALRWRENIWIECLTEYGCSAETGARQGSMWEAFDKASYYKSVQPDRHRRCEPSRATRRDRARLESRCLCSPGEGLRRTCANDRWPRPCGDGRGAWTKIEQTQARSQRYSWQRLSKGAVSLRSRTAQTGTASHFHPRWPTVRSLNWAGFATW